MSGASAAQPAVKRPGTVDEAAAVVRELAEDGRTLRARGGGTKASWAGGDEPRVELDTRGLDRILEHNEGDFTAVLEAGVPLVQAQATFARAGQMLALDPPLGEGDAATLGGVIATNDSGPLRHRYGGVRDLVVGITVVLSDGTVARSGGKVIKNVAGYDLAKLFAGSYGTLGLIARVAVRLHPAPAATATVAGTSADPDRLAAAAGALARLPLEADWLDVAWEAGSGRVLLRFGGAAATRQAEAAAERVEGLDDVEVVTADDDVWTHRRAAQRAPLVVKVSGRPADLPAVLRAAQAAAGSVASRAALGLSWIALPEGADLGCFAARDRQRVAAMLLQTRTEASIVSKAIGAAGPDGIRFARDVLTHPEDFRDEVVARAISVAGRQPVATLERFLTHHSQRVVAAALRAGATPTSEFARRRVVDWAKLDTKLLEACIVAEPNAAEVVDARAAMLAAYPRLHPALSELALRYGLPLDRQRAMASKVLRKWTRTDRRIVVAALSALGASSISTREACSEILRLWEREIQMLFGKARKHREIRHLVIALHHPALQLEAREVARNMIAEAVKGPRRLPPTLWSEAQTILGEASGTPRRSRNRGTPRGRGDRSAS